MTLDTFFEKFHLFADAPNAVAKMRELVLELAVQGKLVEQRPKDLSARECIRKANKPLVDVAPEESVETPAGWIALPLGGLIASNTGGGTPSKQNPKYWNGPIPWASVKDIQSDKYLVSTIDSITQDGLNNSSSNLIPPNRLIVVTRMGLGKLAINTIPIAINQDLRAIEPTTALDLDFAYLLFKSLKMIGSGMTVKGITLDKLHGMPVLLPPLAEQKRIVAKVDELMALCDQLEMQQQERETRHAALARATLARFADAPTPENLNFLFHSSFSIHPSDLRKSILTLAVQGKLVPQDPNDEPAEELLEKIQAERLAAVKARRISPMKLLPPVGADEQPFELQPGWEVVRFIELVMEIQTGPFGSSLHKSDYQIGGTPVINPASLKDGKIVPIDEMAIGSKTLKRLEAFKLCAGDIVMARRGEMGRCAIVTKKEDGWLCGTGSLVVRMPHSLYAPYLAMLIGAPMARMYLAGASVGTTMQNLNQSILAKMPVGVPPLAEQRRIVAKVDALMALVDTLETQIATARTTVTALLEAAVAELTTKD